MSVLNEYLSLKSEKKEKKDIDDWISEYENLDFGVEPSISIKPPTITFGENVKKVVPNTIWAWIPSPKWYLKPQTRSYFYTENSPKGSQFEYLKRRIESSYTNLGIKNTLVAIDMDYLFDLLGLTNSEDHNNVQLQITSFKEAFLSIGFHKAYDLTIKRFSGKNNQFSNFDLTFASTVIPRLIVWIKTHLHATKDKDKDTSFWGKIKTTLQKNNQYHNPKHQDYSFWIEQNKSQSIQLNTNIEFKMDYYSTVESPKDDLDLGDNSRCTTNFKKLDYLGTISKIMLENEYILASGDEKTQFEDQFQNNEVHVFYGNFEQSEIKLPITEESLKTLTRKSLKKPNQNSKHFNLPEKDTWSGIFGQLRITKIHPSIKERSKTKTKHILLSLPAEAKYIEKWLLDQKINDFDDNLGDKGFPMNPMFNGLSNDNGKITTSNLFEETFFNSPNNSNQSGPRYYTTIISSNKILVQVLSNLKERVINTTRDGKIKQMLSFITGSNDGSDKLENYCYVSHVFLFVYTKMCKTSIVENMEVVKSIFKQPLGASNFIEDGIEILTTNRQQKINGHQVPENSLFILNEKKKSHGLENTKLLSTKEVKEQRINGHSLPNMKCKGRGKTANLGFRRCSKCMSMVKCTCGLLNRCECCTQCQQQSTTISSSFTNMNCIGVHNKSHQVGNENSKGITLAQTLFKKATSNNDEQNSLFTATSSKTSSPFGTLSSSSVTETSFDSNPMKSPTQSKRRQNHSCGKEEGLRSTKVKDPESPSEIRTLSTITTSQSGTYLDYNNPVEKDWWTFAPKYAQGTLADKHNKKSSEVSYLSTTTQSFVGSKLSPQRQHPYVTYSTHATPEIHAKWIGSKLLTVQGGPIFRKSPSSLAPNYYNNIGEKNLVQQNDSDNIRDDHHTRRKKSLLQKFAGYAGKKAAKTEIATKKAYKTFHEARKKELQDSQDREEKRKELLESQNKSMVKPYSSSTLRNAPMEKNTQDISYEIPQSKTIKSFSTQPVPRKLTTTNHITQNFYNSDPNTSNTDFQQQRSGKPVTNNYYESKKRSERTSRSQTRDRGGNTEATTTETEDTTKKNKDKNASDWISRGMTTMKSEGANLVKRASRSLSRSLSSFSSSSPSNSRSSSTDGDSRSSSRSKSSRSSNRSKSSRDSSRASRSSGRSSGRSSSRNSSRSLSSSNNTRSKSRSNSLTSSSKSRSSSANERKSKTTSLSHNLKNRSNSTSSKKKDKRGGRSISPSSKKTKSKTKSKSGGKSTRSSSPSLKRTFSSKSISSSKRNRGKTGSKSKSPQRFKTPKRSRSSSRSKIPKTSKMKSLSPRRSKSPSRSKIPKTSKMKSHSPKRSKSPSRSKIHKTPKMRSPSPRRRR